MYNELVDVPTYIWMYVPLNISQLMILERLLEGVTRNYTFLELLNMQKYMYSFGTKYFQSYLFIK